MKVNICGLLHEVKECEDHFDLDLHCGQINFGRCEIRINSGLNPNIKEEAICHEMVHGILVHLGYAEMSQDEKFVQALGNAINQGFKIDFKG